MHMSLWAATLTLTLVLVPPVPVLTVVKATSLHHQRSASNMVTVCICQSRLLGASSSEASSCEMERRVPAEGGRSSCTWYIDGLALCTGTGTVCAPVQTTVQRLLKWHSFSVRKFDVSVPSRLLQNAIMPNPESSCFTTCFQTFQSKQAQSCVSFEAEVFARTSGMKVMQGFTFHYEAKSVRLAWMQVVSSCC